MNIFKKSFYLVATIFITLSFVVFCPSFDRSFILNSILGFAISLIFCALVFFIENLLKKFPEIVFGIVFGIIFGKIFSLTLNGFLFYLGIIKSLSLFFSAFFTSVIYLISTYFSVIVTLSYKNKIPHSLSSSNSFTGVVLSESILCDPRLFAFLSTGILNNRAILPLFIVKSLKAKLDDVNAKKALEMIEKIKQINDLNLKEVTTDFNNTKDIQMKTLLFAKSSNSSILIGDIQKLEEGVNYINFLNIADALKPVMLAGENILIKVQRYGKEPTQGIGYLEDGSMVVINNGGQFIGETIDTKVISIKQTTAGRIIFTNAMVDDEDHLYAFNGKTSYLDNNE
jgi:uncharacterized protein YacL